ncbi:hypothetical protein Pla123a_05960 [Posidoniimonas polymericola]|uniref:Uncharacterized protein n=1 Tax=Posidoniimonas polymericola TaxID=2528002 RepID=A0A5C5ZED4_9BACT|nr:hypothetical protein [Posidoniimonas polymericola]TWT85789.1 hypothetical protein Pla123a_05960 [Posidoniimonas polymericola]
MASRHTSKSTSNRSARLAIEGLEDRRLLAIAWANADPIANGFDAEYGAQADLATAIVRRAIGDWERSITSFNYAVDDDADPNNNLDDTFTLTLSAGAVSGGIGVTSSITYGADLRPHEATITIDDDAGGDGWYFDATPLDDAEFSAAVAPFEANFVDASTAGQAAVRDFYRTVVHEIGHAVGIGLVNVAALEGGVYPYFDAYANPVTNPNSTNTSDTILGSLTHRGIDQDNNLRLVSDPDGTPGSGDEIYAVNELWEYSLAGGGTITFTEADGGHLYNGAPDPNHTSIAVHEHDLMNPGAAAAGSPVAVSRQFISDTNLDLLADAFGYATSAPAGSQDINADQFTAGAAQISFEQQAGTLLVQGLHWDPTASSATHVDDTISITQVGGDIRVEVSYTLDSGDSYTFTRDIEESRVRQIIVAGGGGADSITIATGLADITHEVDYVVTSNQDADDNGALGDGEIDLDTTLGGAQVTLRSAVRDANSLGSAASVYLPPSPHAYVLTLTGTEAGTAAFNDLDIDEDIAIYGAGAGLSVIDASGVSDRVLSVKNGSSLTLHGLTLTGGSASGNGGGVLVDTGGDLALDGVAVVDNSATGSGGGVFVHGYPGSSSADIQNSVFTANSAGQFGGGVMGSQSGATITVGATVLAGNTAVFGGPNFYLVGGAAGTNDGDNLVGTYSGTFFNTSAGDTVNGTPDYIVTSVADQYDSSDDFYAFSLREAIDAANGVSGADEIWLPAWDYLLTIQRTSQHDNLQPTDTDAAFGDLDVWGSLTISRAGALTKSVRWADSTHTDKTFELLGDYNDDHVVDGADYTIYRANKYNTGTDPDEWENLPGDANDDDTVDSSDHAIWTSNYGATLTLNDVS